MLAAVIAPHTIADRSRMNDLGFAIVRFSPFAVASVLVIYVTGIAQSIWLLGSLDALTATAYGRILSLKILLAIVMVGFGAFHQFFIAPRLQPRETEVSAQAHNSGQRFHVSIIAEVAVSLILLAAAGGLTSLPPGRDLAPVPGARVTLQTQPADDLTAMFALTPSIVGFNQFAVRLSTADGAPPVGVEEVLLRLTDVTMDMGESEVALQPYTSAGAAYYIGQSGVISMDGKWKIDLIVRRTGKPDAHATFNLLMSF